MIRRCEHGDAGVWVAERETAHRGDWPAADAAVSDGDWGVLAVQTAACVPVLLSAEADKVEKTDRYTYRDPEEFFSYRREKGVTDRMAASIGAKFSKG